jgi:hypothetical protein
MPGIIFSGMDECWTSELRLSASRARRYALYEGASRVSAAHLEQAVLHQPLGRGARLWRRLGGKVPPDPASLPHPSEQEMHPWANDALRLLARAADRRRWMSAELLDSAHVLLAALQDPASWTGALARTMGRRPEDLLALAQAGPPAALSEPQIREALDVQRRQGGTIGEILVRLGYVDADDLRVSMAAAYDLPIIDLDTLRLDPAAASLLPASVAREHGIVPIQVRDDVIQVVVGNPHAVGEVPRLQKLTGFTIECLLGSEDAVVRALDRLYPGTRAPAPDLEAVVDRLLRLILDTALKARATDLHLERFEDRCPIRYRVDGVLYEMETPPPALAEALVARLKDRAGMERGLAVPQIGGFDYDGPDGRLEIEASLLPTVGGESLVLILPVTK